MPHSSASYPVVAAWAVAAPPPSAFCFLGRPRAMTLVYSIPSAAGYRCDFDDIGSGLGLWDGFAVFPHPFDVDAITKT